MSTKIFIAKGEFIGNLNDSKQSYNINFMPRENNLPDKIRLMIIAPGKKGGDSFLSLYMLDAAQVRLLILDLVKAYAFFKLQKDELNDYTIGYLHQDLSRKVLEILKDVYKNQL